MSRKNRSPEEQAQREKIQELLQSSDVCSIEDIQSLFNETIAEFMENGLDTELDDELGYSKYDCAYVASRTQIIAETITATRRYAPVSESRTVFWQSFSKREYRTTQMGADLTVSFHQQEGVKKIKAMESRHLHSFDITFEHEPKFNSKSLSYLSNRSPIELCPFCPSIC